MSARKRFVVEAEWSGYCSCQQWICHRTVETLFRAGYEAINRHRFSDGTYLTVTVRDAKPREKIQQIHGYSELLRDIAMTEWRKQNKRKKISHLDEDGPLDLEDQLDRALNKCFPVKASR